MKCCNQSHHYEDCEDFFVDDLLKWAIQNWKLILQHQTNISTINSTRPCAFMRNPTVNYHANYVLEVLSLYLLQSFQSKQATVLLQVLQDLLLLKFQAQYVILRT